MPNAIAQGGTGHTISGPDGVRAWTGRAGDPFWIEPDVLHAVGHAFQDGTTVDLSGWDPKQAKNLFAGHTVYAIVLEVPNSALVSTAVTVVCAFGPCPACGRTREDGGRSTGSACR